MMQQDFKLTPLLLDTNVWLDYFLAERAGHKAAFRLIETACRNGVQLCHAVHATKDVFFLAASSMKRAYRTNMGVEPSEAASNAATQTAWGFLRNMNALSTAVGCDASDVWVAEKQRTTHADYEDCLVVAAAIRCSAALLVTSDENLRKHSLVASCSPDDALAYIS